MLQKIFLILCLFLFSTSTPAAFLIEPSVGYHQETLKLTDLAQVQTQIKMNSPVYGLKMGFTNMLGISLDVVGNRSNGKANFTPSLTEAPDYTHTVGSVQIGVNAMGLLKIYLGSIFVNDFEVVTNNFIQGFKLKGQGFQAGVMTFPLPRLGLGIQYNVHQFKEISGTAYTSGPDLKNYFNTVDVQDVSVNISFLF